MPRAISPENFKKSRKKLLKPLQNGNISGIISEHFARGRTFPHVAGLFRLGGGVEIPGGKNKLLEEMKCQ
jgi:hypothetical protein